jgi:hypothetical protein
MIITTLLLPLGHIPFTINLCFTTEGKLATMLIITFSWGFRTSFLVSTTHQQNRNHGSSFTGISRHRALVLQRLMSERELEEKNNKKKSRNPIWHPGPDDPGS